MKENEDFFDISPTLSEKTAVFPGDAPFSREVALDFGRGDSLLLSALRFSAHLGAHCDAPNHYHPQGGGIDGRSLAYYMGPCQVLSVRLPRGARIRPADLGAATVASSRILFKTSSFPNPEKWNDDFNSLSPELVEDLASKGVRLVGIDTPSVDPADSKSLESHNAIYRNNIAILEGVVLDHVDDGHYDLIALPLKIKDGDASPVRAVLLKKGLTGWKH